MDSWSFSDPTIHPEVPKRIAEHQRTPKVRTVGRDGSMQRLPAMPLTARRAVDQPRPLVMPLSARGADTNASQVGMLKARAQVGKDVRSRADTYDSEEEGIVLNMLPNILNVAVKDTVSLLAVEEWHNEPDKDQQFDSMLLHCDARLSRLKRLASKLQPPNACVAAVVFDVLHSTINTLPLVLRNICNVLMKYIEEAVYSPHKMEHADLVHLRKFVGERMDRAPWFVVARKQQDILEAMEDHVSQMQLLVDEHLKRRKNVLAFIIRLQRCERVELQKWIFHYWFLTSCHKRERIIKLSKMMIGAPTSPSTPFMLWRLYVCQLRLTTARSEVDTINLEASRITSLITAGEIENERSQWELARAVEKAAAMKLTCVHAEKEQKRLQVIWESTQPELLLSVLVELLGIFFKLLVETARLSGIAVRQRLAHKNPSDLLDGLSWTPSRGAADATLDAPCEVLLLRWLNSALAIARNAATVLLSADPPPPRSELPWLEMVHERPDCTNLGEDLSDSVALCMLFAVLRAAEEGKGFSTSDLHPLEERDLSLRASSFFSLLSVFAPELRTKCLLVASDIVEARTSLILPMLAEAFLQEPLLHDEGSSKELVVASAQPSLSRSNDASLDNPRVVPASVDFHLCSHELAAVLSKMEACAHREHGDAHEDPSLLLHGGEDDHMLSTLSAEQLLLRWINTLIGNDYSKVVENFASDLQSGEAIRSLLGIVAWEVAPAAWSLERSALLLEVTSVASRCTEFELLTTDAISEAHADVLAVFMAQLFLKRSHLRPKPESLMNMHLDLLETTCREGFNVLATPDDTEKVMGFCSKLSAMRDEINLALTYMKDATKTMQGLHSCLRSFSAETLAARAFGRPRTMLDNKEARELTLYASLSRTKNNLLQQEGPSGVTRLEDLLRKHFRLLREVFKHYATQTNKFFGITLNDLLKMYRECKLRSKHLAPHHLESVFYDQIDTSHAQSGAHLTPSTFVEVLLEFSALKYGNVIPSLPDQLWHLIENHLKPYACKDHDNIFQRMAYDPKVRELLEANKKELQIIFQIYASADVSSGDAMQKVNTMNIKEFHLLLTHCDLLDETLTSSAVQQIFEGIQQSAELDSDGESEESSSDDEDIFGQKKRTREDRRSSSEQVSPSSGLARERRFGINVDMPKEGGIYLGGGKRKGVDGGKRNKFDSNKSQEKEIEDGINDDDELAFSEFFDALVAVAAYKYPDPFAPFVDRLGAFLLGLFWSLRRHWSRKRVSQQVDLMLNVLQKKLLA